MKYKDLLIETAGKMVEKGKGILAADESNPTCGKRFDSIGVSSSFESRNEYRDMLMTAEGIENYISGVIMFDETFRQSTTCDNKINFPQYLLSKGILPGIKVDKGTKDLAGFDINDPVGSANIKVRGALRQLNSEIIMSPDPGRKPGWMSDPRFALVAHIKSWIFTFSRGLSQVV